MARPKKNNADFFSHDADMRNDPKIKALRRKFKCVGYAVWNYILESLTDKDFFQIEWDDLNIELMAADYDVESDELRGIVAYCNTLGLLQIENGFLTCEKLKLRFKPLLIKRNTELGEFPEQKPPKEDISDSKNTHSIVEYSRVDNSREITCNFSLSEKTEKYNILEIFFFKGFIKPPDEVSKFYAHYAKTGWKDKNGNVIINRVAAAELWTQEAISNGKPIPHEFLNLWHKIYNQIRNPLLLEVYTVNVSEADKLIYMKVSLELSQFMEQTRDVLSPMCKIFKYPIRCVI